LTHNEDDSLFEPIFFGASTVIQAPQLQATLIICTRGGGKGRNRKRKQKDVETEKVLKIFT